MINSLYLILSLLYCALFLYGLFVGIQERFQGLRYLLLIITFSLIWDHAVLYAGKSIGVGQLLESLNLSRFWLHALLTPLLALISYDIAKQAGSPLAAKRAALWIISAFTVALILLELFTTTINIKLKPLPESGTLHYVPIDKPSFPLMVMLVLIPVFLAGIILWRHKRMPWMLVGTIIMIIGSLLPLQAAGSVVVNLLEWILIYTIWITIHKLISKR